MSMLLGFVTATMTVTYSVLELIRSKKLGIGIADVNTKNFDFLIPALAAMVTMAVTVLGFVLYRDLTRKRREIDELRLSARLADRKRERVGKQKLTD